MWLDNIVGTEGPIFLTTQVETCIGGSQFPAANGQLAKAAAKPALTIGSKGYVTSPVRISIFASRP